MDFYKKTLLKYLKKTRKNRLIIAIIYTTLQNFSFKILCIIFFSTRPFEGGVTHYYKIMLSLSKFGLSEYAQKPRFWVF